MDCNCCFKDFIGKCDDFLIVNTNLDAGDYIWIIEDKFGNKYQGEVTTYPGGALYIPVEDLPAGLLTQYSGDFTLQIMDAVSCTPIKFKMIDEVDCIAFNVSGGTFEKNYLGCPWP